MMPGKAVDDALAREEVRALMQKFSSTGSSKVRKNLMT